MRTILGGRFENATLRTLTQTPEKPKPSEGHPYYDCLYRRLPPAYFDRSATFMAISQQVLLPQVDWNVSNKEDFGIEGSADGIGEWDEDNIAFAGLMLKHGALSKSSLESLSEGKPSAPKWRLHRDVDGVGAVDAFAHHLLCRILLQVRASGDSDSALVFSDAELQILEEIEKFVVESAIPTPFDLPDVRSLNVLRGETFVGGLLNFSPPDAASVIAVRRNPTIVRYAREIDQHLSLPLNADSQRHLVHAMREAYRSTESGRETLKVFEYQSWASKVLKYVPGIGTPVSIFGDLRDVAKKWIERRQKDTSWYLIGPRMSEIAIEDYLRRKDNL